MRRAILGAILLALCCGLDSLDARPNRYGHSDREERHMLPAVSSGPLNPVAGLFDARRHLEGSRGRRRGHRTDLWAGGWVAARSVGPKSPYLGDDYAFAQTSPVYVVRGGRRFIKSTDVQFLLETVNAIAVRVEKARWRSDAERQTFGAAIEKASAFYRSLIK